MVAFFLKKNYFSEDKTFEYKIKDFPNNLTGDGIIPTYFIFIDKGWYFQWSFLCEDGKILIIELKLP